LIDAILHIRRAIENIRQGSIASSGQASES